MNECQTMMMDGSMDGWMDGSMDGWRKEGDLSKKGNHIRQMMSLSHFTIWRNYVFLAGSHLEKSHMFGIIEKPFKMMLIPCKHFELFKLQIWKFLYFIFILCRSARLNSRIFFVFQVVRIYRESLMFLFCVSWVMS